VKSYIAIDLSATEKSAITQPILVRGSTYAMVDMRILTGALDGSFVASLMWRLDPGFPWRPFNPVANLTAAAPYTTDPVDVSCIHEIALQVTTVSGTAANLAVCVTTDNIDAR